MTLKKRRPVEILGLDLPPEPHMDKEDVSVRPLVCFAKGRPGEWEAICLTLDIAVQGGSEEEVQRSLREAIMLFLQSVRDECGPEVRQKLLGRRAPFAVWLRYVSSFFLHVALSRHRRYDGYSEAGFVMPCPA